MSHTVQEKNKKLVLEGFDVLLSKRDFAHAEKDWSPNYIQHRSRIELGRDGLFNLVKSLPTGSFRAGFCAPKAGGLARTDELLLCYSVLEVVNGQVQNRKSHSWYLNFAGNHFAVAH